MRNKSTKHNPWKWAFFTLLTLILLVIGTIFFKATAPTNVPAQQEAYPTTDTSVAVTLNRRQVNALSKNYLERFLKDDKVKYRFVVGNKYATVIGKTHFLGAQVQFALNFIPKRLSNGNILLQTKGLSVGQLNLPVKFVLSYIKSNYKLPNWVYVNQKKKTITLDLNRYSKHRSLHYSAQEVHMEKGEFKFLITIPKGGK